MVLFQLKHGPHKGMILNLEPVIYLDPVGKALAYIQPTPIFQLEDEDWRELSLTLLRRAQDSGVHKLGPINLDLSESSADDNSVHAE